MQNLLTNTVRSLKELDYLFNFQNNFAIFQFWPSLVGNCHLNRPIAEQVKNSGLFTKTEVVEFNPKFNEFMMGVDKLIGHEIYGWAAK